MVMGGTESGVGEFSVGSIVWVRRRNGSWWPGKIVGPEELSASHLTSPRSGTPVKLLGREDASVDWYNLEKSKRVKAFRCGEFDECIRRAECSHGMQIKKREKYARREDAILHALDLEKQQHSRKLGTPFDSTKSNHKSFGGPLKKGLLITTTPPETLGNNRTKLGNSKSNPISKRLEANKTEILESCPSYSQKLLKEGNQLSGEEEDHLEALPRMRGLQDFGLKIVPSKTTPLSSFLVSNGSRKPVIEDTVEASVGASHANGITYLEKRKRSIEEETFSAKRRDKQRPIDQVLQSSVKLEQVPPQSMEFDGAASISGVSEPAGAFCRAKRSRFVYVPPQAESSESLDYKTVSHSDIEMSDSQNEPFTRPISLNVSGSCEDEESDSSETETTESESDSSETEDMAAHSDAILAMDPETSCMGRNELQEQPDEMMDMPRFYSHYRSSSAHDPVSKWQLKGKRNLRNLTKRSADTEEKDFRGEMMEVYRGQNLVEWADWNWDDHHQQHFCSSSSARDVKRERSDPLHLLQGKSRSMLFDVELSVQASYKKEHVPIVSLTSKLNGKVIIGHPIRIESLEDGSSSSLVSAADELINEPTIENGDRTLPRAWRTARRTANFRVPRPRTSLDGDENPGFEFPFLDRENKAAKKSGSSAAKKRKKGTKKASLSSSSSQKTRTLSSIAIEHSLFNKATMEDGVLKLPESSSSSGRGLTMVSCIPVKLVFSRLLEKINRPPSKAVLGLTNERNPS